MFYLNFNECNNELLYLFYQTFSQQKDLRECDKMFGESMQKDSYIFDSHGICQPVSTGYPGLLEYEQYQAFLIFQLFRVANLFHLSQPLINSHPGLLSNPKRKIQCTFKSIEMTPFEKLSTIL